MRGRLWRGMARGDEFLEATPADAWVLELGCGDGKFLRALDEAGRKAVGLDRARNALTLSRQSSPAALVQADVQDLPFRDASVPAVAARFVIGALPGPGRRRAAAEAWRVLAPGGVLYVVEFGRDDFRASQGREIEPGTFERNRGILTHYWTREEVEALLPTPPTSVEERRWKQRAEGIPRTRQVWRAFWERAANAGAGMLPPP